MTIFTKLNCWATLIFILLSFCSLGAQQWKQLQQLPLQVRYEVPREWYVGGVMKEKACHCKSGTLNSSYKGNINMVLFENNNNDPELIKKQDIWGYNYIDAPVVQSIQAKNFVFEQSVSTWREDTTLQVIRLYAKKENTHFVLYFWGDPESLAAQSAVIERIIKSVELVEEEPAEATNIIKNN